ncbi:MAG: carboxypeptidase-like regulatory domain-containing protein, partial [Cytophagales bacterium]|nr:carboxypeptidase-like regulatory domain-containing protein [Cytophagales bacterium]
MRKSYKPLLLLVLLCLSSGSAWAQRAVSGRVTDSGDGTPLPGVSVALKGTTSGTTTNADGRYTLQAVPDNAVLVFSFIGFTAQEVTVGNRSTIDVGLVSDVKALQEVVVTAQGIVREKKALGYAVTSVAPALIEQRPETDLGRILQGKVPGVAVTSTGGVSGTGTNIVIRGYSSITGNNQPLFVVDGVPINSGTNNVSGSNTSGFNTGNQSTPSRFLDIDPNNIENVSILRGLAATALYGDQGRAGVILITTKGGGKKAKPAEINLVQSVFVNRIASLPEYQNNYGGGFQQNPGFFFSNWGPRFGSYFPPNLTNGVDSINHPFNALQDASLRNAFPQFIGRRYAFRAYDGPEAFFRTGVISNSSLNVNGATEKMGYNATVGYVDEQGFVPGNTLRKLNVSLGMNAQLTDKLSIRSAFNYVNTDQASPPLNGGDGNNSFNDFPSIFANVLYTPRSVDLMGLPFESPVDNRSVYFRSGNDIVNPRWAVKYYKTTNVTNRFFTSNIVNYAVNPDLMLTYRVGLDTYSERQTVELNRGGTQAAVVNGYFRNVNITNTIWNHDFIISYNKRLSELFNIAAKLGGNMRNDRFVQDGMASLNQITFGLMRHSNFVDNAARDPFTNNILNL